MLRMAMTETPWLEIDPTVRAMRGAANVMLGRFEEATDDLFLEEFDSSLEMGVWRGAWYAQTGDLAAAAREFERSGRVIDRYPAKLRVDLRMLVAESLLATQQIGLADNFLDSILVDRPRQNVVDRVTYLRGLTTAAAGRPLEAIDILEKAAQSQDRYTRGLAEWARIEMMLEENMIRPDEAVQGLEVLRFAWRGDEFELNLLHRLGNLYIVRGDYNNGLTTYRETISVFPDSAKVREIAQTMNDTFSALFLDGKADELPPITALAIYNDFRELTPVGNLGDQLIFRLSDRLVGVDLLEQAAELLQHQVEFRLRGGDLARVGARLAGIYMLDQKPERAVSALRASDVVRMPEPLSQQRHYLLTRALAESGDVDKALGLLRGDQSREANLLRADIYWKTQDWLEEATVIERLFHDRDPDAPLDAMEGQYLIRMAIALALSNNRQALAELRERFGPMMRETVNADAFFVLASYVDSGPIDPSDLASIVNEIGSYEAFMVSLREQVASETLSAVN